MGLDIWFREDIWRALKAAEQASATTAAACGDVMSPEAAAYRDGYKAALVTVAAAFGVDRESREHDWRREKRGREVLRKHFRDPLPSQEIFA